MPALDYQSTDNETTLLRKLVRNTYLMSLGGGGGGSGDMSKSTYDPASIAEQLVGLTASQTLTNKTLYRPTIDLGTISDTTSRPLAITQTWNNAGLTANAVEINVTDTNSTSSSKLISSSVGGAARFTVAKDGAIVSNCATAGTGLALQTLGAPYFRAANFSGVSCYVSLDRDLAIIQAGALTDTYFSREAAATWKLGLDAAGVVNQMLKACDRITSDGVGANLTLAGGRNRGASSGGSLIFQTSAAAGAGVTGTLTTRMTINGAGQIIMVLPTSSAGLPSGALWNNANVVNIIP